MCFDSDTVRMTPISEIVATIESSCDFGYVSDYDSREVFWEHWLRNKAMDTGFGYLIDSLLANGFSPEGAVSWCSDEKAVNEGHHRIAAAILLCVDEIPTTCWGKDWYKNGQRLSAHSNWNDPEPIHL